MTSIWNPIVFTGSVKQEVVGEIFAMAVELGGTLSGEHGVGVLKRAFMEDVRDHYDLEGLWSGERMDVGIVQNYLKGN